MRIADSTVLPSIAGTEKIPTSPTGHITPNMLKAFVLPYDEIIFKLTQTGTGNPVYNEIYNPAGIGISVVRDSAGIYFITLDVAFTMDNIIICTMQNFSNTGVGNLDSMGARVDVSIQKLIIETASLSAGMLVDDILFNSGFCIKKFH